MWCGFLLLAIALHPAAPGAEAPDSPAKKADGPASPADAAAALTTCRQYLIEQAKAPEHLTVSFEIRAGTQVPAKLLAADEKGFRVNAQGLEVSLTWQALGPEGTWKLCRDLVKAAPADVHEKHLLLALALGRAGERDFEKSLTELFEKDRKAAQRIEAARKAARPAETKEADVSKPASRTPPVAVAAGEDRPELSQHGITWTFDRPAKTGKFVNGDGWVIGPVTVVSVTPACGKPPADEQTNLTKNRWGDTGLRVDERMRNGSVVNPGHETAQGYDSRIINYEPKLSAKFPLALQPNQSLVSTISHTQMPNEAFPTGWFEKSNSALRTAAVLTCLAAPPPADAFRPSYTGSEKPIYRAAQLKRERLLRLKPVPETPEFGLYARYFERVWLDHQLDWLEPYVAPTENAPPYGREWARMTGIAGLMLHLDAPAEQREKLLVGLVQLGIDLNGRARTGGSWSAGGGILSGRKWPIVFAGLMLDDKAMQALPETVLCQEDTSTYYGKGWTGATALYQLVTHHGPRQPYEEKPPAQWDEFDNRGEDYRRSSTTVGWVPEALAARLTCGMEAWNHDAFFDYCDRWMTEDDTQFSKQAGRKPDQRRTFDRFVDNMWHAYRKMCPEQKGGAQNLKWSWEKGKGGMAANPKPEGGGGEPAKR
ncbi:MAG: hypothetical protein NTW87_31390 [Planctomycetota bacterium]|nr:hypothetical protein [Planctomycetota bacterium]